MHAAVRLAALQRGFAPKGLRWKVCLPGIKASPFLPSPPSFHPVPLPRLQAVSARPDAPGFSYMDRKWEAVGEPLPSSRTVRVSSASVICGGRIIRVHGSHVGTTITTLDRTLSPTADPA